MLDYVFPAPVRDLDNAPFWDYIEAGEVRLQRCRSCEKFWNPPGPACPTCLESNFEWLPLSPTGTLSSWVTFNHDFWEGAQVPYTVVNVDMPEGVRILADVIDVADGDELRAGMPLALSVEATVSGWKLPQFRIVR